MSFGRRRQLVLRRGRGLSLRECAEEKHVGSLVHLEQLLNLLRLRLARSLLDTRWWQRGGPGPVVAKEGFRATPHPAWFSAHRRQDGSRGVCSGEHRPSNVVPPSLACNLVFLQHMCLKRGQRF